MVPIQWEQLPRFRGVGDKYYLNQYGQRRSVIGGPIESGQDDTVRAQVPRSTPTRYR
jgi:hypothetical protein